MRKFSETVLKYLNILAALLLLVSYSAPVINPARIVFPAFTGLAYPYLLLLNLVFLLYWTIRFKKELTISLLAILIGWGHLTNFLPISFSSGAKTENIRETDHFSIMSYNVRTFDYYDWGKQDNSVDGIFKIISERSPDILCLQEFYTGKKPGFSEEEIKRKLNDFPHHSIYYNMNGKPGGGFGIATFSRYPILKTSRIPFDNTGNQAVYTDIKAGKDTVRVFNIHLQSIRFGKSNYTFIDSLSLKYSGKQLMEAREIGVRLRDAFILRAEQSAIIHNYIKSSPYPVIVAGDFNDTPTSYAYRKIKKGLLDAFKKAGRGFGNTYAGEFPSFRIDFILYSKELEAVSFDRIKSKYSDHYPVISTLRRKPGD